MRTFAVATLIFSLHAFGQSTRCDHITEIVEMARETSASKLLSKKIKRPDTYFANVVRNARLMELRPSRDAAISLLDLIPKAAEQEELARSDAHVVERESSGSVVSRPSRPDGPGAGAVPGGALLDGVHPAIHVQYLAGSHGQQVAEESDARSSDHVGVVHVPAEWRPFGPGVLKG